MAGRLRAIGLDNSSTHKFVVYNALNQAWNGTAFETWDDTHFATYGVTATRIGTTERYVGDEPSGAVWYELWLWTGTLGTSYPVNEGVIEPNVDGSGRVEASNIGDGAQVVIAPFNAVTTNPRYSTRNLPPVAKGSAPTDVWIVTDAQGTPINLTGKTVRFVAYTETDPDGDTPFDEIQTAVYKCETAGDGITIGPGVNQVNVTRDTGKTAVAGAHKYYLWNISDNLPLAKGSSPIEPAVKSYP